VRSDRPIQCSNGSSSRIVSSNVSRRLADGLGNRFTSRHVFGRANLVSRRAWPKVSFLAHAEQPTNMYGQASVEIARSEFSTHFFSISLPRILRLMQISSPKLMRVLLSIIFCLRCLLLIFTIHLEGEY
jgi:hypothetical protein